LHVTQKVAVFLAGIALVGIALFEFADTASRFKALQDSSLIVHTSYGSGLIIVLLGGLAVVVGAVMALAQDR
jgi:hypothetical protein